MRAKMRRVAVVGAGITKYGKRTDASLKELAFEAVKKSLMDCGLEISDIDASVISVANQYLAQQTQPGAIINSYIGMCPKPSFTTVDACGSGSAAIRAAWMSIASGLHDVVLVVGAEKMTEIDTPQAIEYMGFAGDPLWELRPTGITDAGLYAMFANAHMEKYGTTQEQLALVAVKNHKYAAMNPISHLKKEITVEDVMKSKMVSYPLKLFDCSPISDGAAALILACEERAKKITEKPVYFLGLGAATDTVTIFEREDLTGLMATREAAKRAYAMAGIGPSDIDVADVHDCFTIAEIMAYEDLGFCKKGEGGKFIEEKRSYLEGDKPVNVDGGLKAKGHPLGATGVGMVYEIVKQLRGEAGPRQVKGAKIGLTHNVSRDGTHVFVQILGVDF